LTKKKGSKLRELNKKKGRINAAARNQKNRLSRPRETKIWKKRKGHQRRGIKNDDPSSKRGGGGGKKVINTVRHVSNRKEGKTWGGCKREEAQNCPKCESKQKGEESIGSEGGARKKKKKKKKKNLRRRAGSFGEEKGGQTEKAKT